MADRLARRERAYLYAILGALLFMSLAWAGPMLYYATAPGDHFLAIEEFRVQNASATGEHTLAVTYSSDGEYPSTGTLTLYRSGENGDEVIDQWVFKEFSKKGTHSATIGVDPESNLTVGAYYYEFEIEYAVGYNVKKRFTETSDKFVIDPEANESTSMTETETGG